jgi:hypothetical protein
VLCIGGFAVMLFGVAVLDLVEGALVILAGSGLAALGAFLGGSRFRKLAYWSFGLMLVGLGVTWIVSAPGNFRGQSELTGWWILVVVPYVLGVIAGLVGAACTSFEALLGADRFASPGGR